MASAVKSREGNLLAEETRLAVSWMLPGSRLSGKLLKGLGFRIPGSGVEGLIEVRSSRACLVKGWAQCSFKLGRGSRP